VLFLEILNPTMQVTEVFGGVLLMAEITAHGVVYSFTMVAALVG
jgi:hypothetical protein